MPLNRASCQPSKTLEQFYQELAGLPTDKNYPPIAQEMLKLLPALREAIGNLDVWGLTSHERLCLLARDDYASPWFVIVRAVPPKGFEVRYLMPESDAPWRGAYVEGIATSVEMACEFVVTALRRSRGWTP